MSGSISGNTQSNISVSPSVAQALAVTGAQVVLAGTPSSTTVRAVDAYGHTATAYTGTVHFTQRLQPRSSPTTFAVNDHGVRSFSNAVTLRTAGAQSVTATDTGTGEDHGHAGRHQRAARSRKPLRGVVACYLDRRPGEQRHGHRPGPHGNTECRICGVWTNSDTSALLLENPIVGSRTLSNGVTLKTAWM